MEKIIHFAAPDGEMGLSHQCENIDGAYISMMDSPGSKPSPAQTPKVQPSPPI